MWLLFKITSFYRKLKIFIINNPAYGPIGFIASAIAIYTFLLPEEKIYNVIKIDEIYELQNQKIELENQLKQYIRKKDLEKVRYEKISTIINGDRRDLYVSIFDEKASTGNNTKKGDRLFTSGWVQIASQSSLDAARSTYLRFYDKQADIISGLGVVIVAADIPGRGTFYRVNIPAKSFEDAKRMCKAIRANGGDCLPKR